MLDLKKRQCCFDSLIAPCFIFIGKNKMMEVRSMQLKKVLDTYKEWFGFNEHELKNGP